MVGTDLMVRDCTLVLLDVYLHVVLGPDGEGRPADQGAQRDEVGTSAPGAGAASAPTTGPPLHPPPPQTQFCPPFPYPPPPMGFMPPGFAAPPPGPISERISSSRIVCVFNWSLMCLLVVVVSCFSCDVFDGSVTVSVLL